MGNESSKKRVEVEKPAEIDWNAIKENDIQEAKEGREREMNDSQNKDVEYWRLRLEGEQSENGRAEIAFRDKIENEGKIFERGLDTRDFEQYEYYLYGDLVLGGDEESGEKSKDIFDRDVLGIPVGIVPYIGFTQGIYGEVKYTTIKRNEYKDAPNLNVYKYDYPTDSKEMAKEYFKDYKGYYRKLGINVDDSDLPNYFNKVRESMK